jgi:hypothetical protein
LVLQEQHKFKHNLNPTAVYDPDNITNPPIPTSKREYDYYNSLITRTEGIKPNGQERGTIVKRFYDSIGRLDYIYTENNQAFVKFKYSLTNTLVEKYATINVTADPTQYPEQNPNLAYEAVYTDGAGRTRKATSRLPNSTGGYATTFLEYDNMGRVWRQSLKTETDRYDQPTGLDASGPKWTSQTFDWKGRPLVITSPDNSTKEFSYAGCGCAASRGDRANSYDWYAPKFKKLFENSKLTEHCSFLRQLLVIQEEVKG